MAQPVQQHYLPKNSHLKFFVADEKPNFVWMYQRNEEPILVNIDNVAKERHLYSFKNEDGKYDTQLETAFEQIENTSSKIFEKINKAQGQIVISGQEKSDLAYYLAMQVTRTPAFRNNLKLQAEELVRWNMQGLVANEETFERVLKDAKKEKPDMPDVSIQEMRDFIFGDKIKIDMGNDNYFLKQSVELGDHIYPSIMMKDIFILRSSSVKFITCDYPLNLIPRPGVPSFWGGGFIMSGILVPIGTYTALFCKNPDTPHNPPMADDKISLGYKEMTASESRWVNKVAINHAERFLFASVCDFKIKELFDKTDVPKRFHTSSKELGSGTK